MKRPPLLNTIEPHPKSLIGRDEYVAGYDAEAVLASTGNPLKLVELG